MKCSSIALALLLTACAGEVPAAKSCCAGRKSIRAIDRTCLPTCPSVANIELYRGDIEAQYVQIAYVDSFVGDDDCTPTIQAMLKDLQVKGQAVGADAVIRVKLLHNQVRGWKENMRTPFWSVEQGRWEEPFFRGIAIKYQKWPEDTPDERAERPLNIEYPPEKTKPRDSRNPFKRGNPGFAPAGLGSPRL